VYDRIAVSLPPHREVSRPTQQFDGPDGKGNDMC
jgi:hypothetical protein